MVERGDLLDGDLLLRRLVDRRAAEARATEHDRTVIVFPKPKVSSPDHTVCPFADDIEDLVVGSDAELCVRGKGSLSIAVQAAVSKRTLRSILVSLLRSSCLDEVLEVVRCFCLVPRGARARVGGHSWRSRSGRVALPARSSAVVIGLRRAIVLAFPGPWTS